MAAALAGLAVACAWPAVSLAGGFEDEVLAELNRARANPRALAYELRRERGRPARIASRGAEDQDPRAVEDAIDFLMRQPPLPALDADARLSAAADELVRAQGRRGEVGHGAAGDLGRRMQRRGVWAGMSGEAISYGQPSPREVVRQLIVDAGVADRGHRAVLFDRSFQIVGVACGDHAVWGGMCVIDLAGALPVR